MSKKSKTTRKPSLFSSIIRLSLHLSDAEALEVSTRFAEDGLSSDTQREHGDHSPWVLQVVTEHRPDTSYFFSKIEDVAAEKSFAVTPVADVNWLEASYRAFPAFPVGPFFIYGSHHQDDVPEDKTGLLIDAATAFGSGEHGTTKGCLLAMIDMKEAGICPWNVLDMGTGSGILSIAAWKLWKTPVLAVDNDTEAVRVAERHGIANGVSPGDANIVYAVSEGFESGLLGRKKPFDLIIANILAATLIPMAPQLAAATDNNGHVILSGILHSQAENVLAAYAPFGLKLTKKYAIDEWSTLVLQKA